MGSNGIDDAPPCAGGHILQRFAAKAGNPDVQQPGQPISPPRDQLIGRFRVVEAGVGSVAMSARRAGIGAFCFGEMRAAKPRPGGRRQFSIAGVTIQHDVEDQSESVARASLRPHADDPVGLPVHAERGIDRVMIGGEKDI